MADRQASILTNSQRDFLKEGGDGASARMARKRIRERAHEALFDFPLLVSGLDEKDRKWIFEDHDLENKDHTLNVLSSAFAFLYLGITDTVEPSDLAKDAFEDMVGSGVEEAYRARGEPVADVSVSVDITPIDSSKPVEDMTLREILEHANQDNMDNQILLQRLTEAVGEKQDTDDDSLFEVYDLDLSGLEEVIGPEEDTEE